MSRAYLVICNQHKLFSHYTEQNIFLECGPLINLSLRPLFHILLILSVSKILVGRVGHEYKMAPVQKQTIKSSKFRLIFGWPNNNE